MKDSKTIKQIADEIGVSKQAVHQKRKSKALSTTLQPFTSTVDGVVYISVDGINLLKQAFQSNSCKRVDDNIPSTLTTSVDGHVDGENQLYTLLKKELEYKNKQIETLQSQLEAERIHSREQTDKIVQLADQAQRLQLAQMKPSQNIESGKDNDSENTENKKSSIFVRFFKKNKV